MKPNIFVFKKTQVTRYCTLFYNLCRFLPYYFSVTRLLKTLFSPWKRVRMGKTRPGFSFNEFFGRVTFNLISAVIGLVMRLALLTVYICFQVIVIILFVPCFMIFFVFSLCILYPVILLMPSEDAIKQKRRAAFVALRCEKPENKSAVEAWFERYYHLYHTKSRWWELPFLFTIPPLARDWSMGYTVTLDQYGEELTRPKEYERHLVGRKKEIEQIEQVLTKSSESNVIIAGEEGVGKHTIVEAMARRIYQGTTAQLLAYKRVIQVHMEKILSEHTDIHRKEELVRLIFEEAASAGNIILVIENLDRYITGGEGRMDLTASMEPLAKTSRVQCIGITTPFLYQTYVFPNEKIRRIFQKVDVHEITKDEAMVILMDASSDFEQRFRVLISYETIKAIVEKSEFYITTIPFPEKAIELLDEACAYLDRKRLSKETVRLTTDIIDTVLSEKMHVPTKLTDDVVDKLTSLESVLASRIIDQQEAIAKAASTLRRSFLLLGKRKKPFSALLFLGPTGVGKTQTAKEIAKFFFGSETYLFRFDMSSYQTKEDVLRLIGSGEKHLPGILTETIRNNPYGVLLLDELEKANKDLLNIFLTVFDEGYFTDGSGKPVDCKNLIIVATSNAGSDLLYTQMAKPESGDRMDSTNEMVDYLIEGKLFSPEFLNRFDQIILFQPLSRKSIMNIARQELNAIADVIQKQYGVTLMVSDEYLTELVKKNYNQQFGARNMQRILRDSIEDLVAQRILEKKAKEGDMISL